jgi:hypothetical protein
VTTFAGMEGEETFDSSFFGHADEVVQERIANDDVILVKGTTSMVCTFSIPILSKFATRATNFIWR